MSFGVLTTGFAPKTYEDALTELKAALRQAFGASLPLGDTSVLGQLSAIVANQLGELWETAEAVVAAQNAESAEGSALDSLCALAGLIRKSAQRSTCQVIFTGDALAEVAVGVKVQTVSTEQGFEVVVADTLATATLRAASTAYVLGDIRGSGTRIFVCSEAGTSSSTVGIGPLDDSFLPDPLAGAAIPDGTATWRWLGDGEAYASIECEAVETGPIAALTYDLADIQTPTAGVLGAGNIEDATPGRDVETDAQLRARRLDTLFSAITYPSGNAIRRALLLLTGVQEARVFTNSTDAEEDGIPPHGLEVVVRGGEDVDIAAELFEVVGAGVAYAGTTSYEIVDAEGVTQTVQFSRPDEIDVYIDVDLEIDPAVWEGAAGEAAVLAAILAFGETIRTGRDVVCSQIASLAYGSVGVLDAVVRVGTSPSPATTTKLAIALREIAVFDSARITITTTEGTP